MEIMKYLAEEKGRIHQEFEETKTCIIELETQLSQVRVKLEHLRGSYQRIEQMEQDISQANENPDPAA